MVIPNISKKEDSYEILTRVLKRRITTKTEMNLEAWKRFPPGSYISDLEAWLISEGWTLEDWKQSERDKKKIARGDI